MASGEDGSVPSWVAYGEGKAESRPKTDFGVF